MKKKNNSDRKPFRKDERRRDDSGRQSERAGDKGKDRREWKGGKESSDRKPFRRNDDGRKGAFRKDERRRDDSGRQSERAGDRGQDRREWKGGKESSDRKPFRRNDDGRKGTFRKDERRRDDAGKGFDRDKSRGQGSYRDRKESYGERNDRQEGAEKKYDSPYKKGNNNRRPFPKKWDQKNIKKAFSKPSEESVPSSTIASPATGQTRLNKYLSNAGICSRREADKFIEAGVVTVNGKIITELGYKVNIGDKVQFGGNKVNKEKTVYVLLNKPKGYITTCDDPQERDTVMDLIKGVEERVYPVGRLDRQTSGLLLLTNDGDLATKLMHPKYNVAKVYHVELDKPFRPEDMDKIKLGIELEDGFIKPDDIAYVEGAKTRKEIGVEIHSGRNRIVRRIFESLGYIVMKLDRVFYAGLTKQTLSRGKWRFLAENEVRMLKRIK